MVRVGSGGPGEEGAERSHDMQTQGSGKLQQMGWRIRKQDRPSRWNFGGCSVWVKVQILRARPPG